MSTSSNISQSVYSPSELDTSQDTQSRIQSFDQSLKHVDLGISLEQSMKNAQKEMHQKRIQSLRKELEYLKSTEWKFEYDKGFAHNDDDYKEDFLAEQLLDLEISEEQNINVTSDTNSEIPHSAVCFQRTGVIKYIDESYSHVLIDGVLYFEYPISFNLNVNDKILYLGYKDSNNSIVVVRILENLGPSWGEEEENETDSFKVIEHVIIGEVADRQERFVYIKDADLKFNLDNVSVTFVPVKGDWLELKCTVQWVDSKPTDIASAQVLEVKTVKALRSLIKRAIVTDRNGETGTCDRRIYFDKRSVQNGAMPDVGSTVMVEAVESSQGSCTWRAIKLITTEHNSSKLIVNDILNEQDKSLQTEKDKNIEITYPLIFDKVHFQQTKKLMLNITNKGEQMHTIYKWIILSNKRDSQVDIKPFLSCPVRLNSGDTFSLTLKCNPKFLGKAKESLIIKFRGFQIKRSIEINVIDSNFSKCNTDSDCLKPNTESRRIESMLKVRNNQDKSIVSGVRPVKPPAFIPVKLGMFPIPEKIWASVLGDSEKTIYSSDYGKILDRLEANLPCLSQELNINNYIDKWHTLLYMEEIQANINMRVYDMPKAFLIRCQEYLALEICGLAEKRPSLIVGDRVIVKDSWDNNASQYEGYIHIIKGDLILMKFNQYFQEHYSGSDVSVEFHFTRSAHRRSHQAVNLAITYLGPDILFPTQVLFHSSQIPIEKLKSIQWFNKNLNDGQKEAVTNILLGESRPLPYCIYGPPGTGKTVTVVETILQILTLLPDSRILVATPSNSASNLITERILAYRNVFSDSVIRLIANYLASGENIPDLIKPFCATLDLAKEDSAKPKYTVSNGINLNCRKSFIGRHRVTIGTCMCIGSLAQIGLPKGHFTHIIIDEAGQATEPEIMIPLTFVDKENGQIILAGDPMQLGPVIMSKYCKEFGMDESYLNRILETFPYQRDYDAFATGYNKKLVTKLNDNYRSLKEILSLPSEIFYDGTLVPKMDRNQKWIEHLIHVVSDIFDSNDKNTGGIHVYGIRGNNTRAVDNPSWFNPQEASMVALTTCKLYKKNVNVDDIGIITPYIAQIKHLRLVFDAMGLPQPKIGTVEEFQGQERPIILISTVRSSESHIQDDMKYILGFVNNPKRVNVALTRAQVAVILFCNPHLLCADPLWGKVIKHAVETKKYMGCDLPSIFNINNGNIE